LYTYEYGIFVEGVLERSNSLNTGQSVTSTIPVSWTSMYPDDVHVVQVSLATADGTQFQSVVLVAHGTTSVVFHVG
jgi:hypothetical protein